MINNNGFPYLKNEINCKNIKESVNRYEGNQNKVLNLNSNEDIKDKLIHSNFVISINGIKYIDNISEINKEKYLIDNIKDTEKLILKLQTLLEKYIKEIKKNIDNIFIDDKQKHGINMKMGLNKIMSEMNLFKSNYQDFIKYNIKL